jgi:DNA replication protein DnaC
MTKIYDYCKRYAERFSLLSQSVFMLGDTGLGKTHLSLAIAGKVIEKGYHVLYGSMQDFLRAIEDEHFGRSNHEQDTLRLLLETDLLILDDLGVEFNSEFNVATVYNIINTRLNADRPTIINSNLSVTEIEKKYTKRIVSRLFSNYTCLRFAGNDIRLQKKAGKFNKI